MIIVTTLNNSEKIAKKIVKGLNAKYSKTEVKEFPDGELYLRYKTELKKKKVIIVESFQPNAKGALMNIIFAAKTAKELGAKKVILVAPYLGFMRQDKRFNSGECVSAPIMAELLNTYVDKILTVDPHLHRIRKMKEVFTIPAKNLTSNGIIADFIKKKFKNEVIIGPDWESYQWADEISKAVGVQDTVLEKTRHTFRNVDVKVKNEIEIYGKNVIIVDDIISTGNTMIKALKEAKKRGAKTVSAIGVHGLFVEKGLAKMKRAGFDNIFTVNTIVHETNKIDISPVIIEELSKRC
jgi:ribose-phosphate pyrophosphokinase